MIQEQQVEKHLTPLNMTWFFRNIAANYLYGFNKGDDVLMEQRNNEGPSEKMDDVVSDLGLKSLERL